jgi:hypothetical protein
VFGYEALFGDESEVIEPEVIPPLPPPPPTPPADASL